MADSSIPGSTRNRIPRSGRTNLNQNGPLSSARKSEGISITSEDRRRWNDTLNVSRNFSPRDPFYKDTKTNPPILPPSIYPTIPEVDKPQGFRRPLSCPNDWIERTQTPNAFESSALASEIDEEGKEKHCRDFLERNQPNLWKYNVDYIKKTPRTICREITTDLNYASIMVKLHKQEKHFKLSNSDSTRNCLIIEKEPVNKLGKDPFLTSLSTPRTSRNEKKEYLFHQDFLDTTHRRGHNHAPEYGNFSRFNGILKSNQASVLKR